MTSLQNYLILPDESHLQLVEVLPGQVWGEIVEGAQRTLAS